MYVRAHSRSGVALVLVLTMLVLLSALLVAFMTSATTETAAAKAFSNQMDARQAADAAVNMVIGQLRDATTSTEDGASPDKSKGPTGFTWASQPGAIRTFGSANNSTVYKLYSATTMRQTEAEYKQAAQEDAAVDLDPEEASERGFVDLNEPALAPTADSTPGDPRFEARYPIVNPYGKYTYTQGSGKFNTGSSPTPGEGAVEGFYCDDRKDNNRKDADGNPLPLLPMRVKWVYILKDGTMAPVDAQGKIIGATIENPPVARTAFWTDDESSKLNINTATEGTYWDVPSVGTMQESGDVAQNGAGPTRTNTSSASMPSFNLAVSQPARNEWQRYPGHPAQTCLSPALRWLFPAYKNPFTTAGYSNDPDVNFKEAIYRMAPRVVGGKAGRNPGSNKNHNGTTLAGTWNTDSSTPNSPLNQFDPIAADKDRLYATIDEYFFRPDRTPRDRAPELTSIWGGTGADVAMPEFRPEHVDKLRFFLTANSRTPELNMFGRPRVTIWPIHGNNARQTEFDDLFAYCSTLGTKKYFFYRQYPQSATLDYTSFDGNNVRLYEYLQFLTDQSVPWLGKTIRSKYTSVRERDQILTEIFDYIRTTNLVDTSTTKATAGSREFGASYTDFYWPANGSNSGKQTNMPKPYSGQVTPIRINDTKGFGRFPTVAEAALLFYKPTTFSYNPDTGITSPPAGTTPMQAVLLLEMFNPAQGYPALRDTYSVRVRVGPFEPAVDMNTTPVPRPDRDKFYVFKPGAANPGNYNAPDDNNVKELRFPDDMFNMVTVDPYTGPVARVFMPTRGFANQFIYDTRWPGLRWDEPGANPVNFPTHPWDGTTTKKNFRRQDFTGRDSSVYPFYSDTVFLPNAGTDTWNNRFGLRGGTFIIDIYPTTNPGNNDEPVQSIRIKFEDIVPAGGGGLAVPTAGSDFQSRLTKGVGTTSARSDLGTGGTGGMSWIEDTDTIRSYEVGFRNQGAQSADNTTARGDIRLAAALSKVGFPNLPGANFYQPRGGIALYQNTAKQQVHGLRVSRGGYYPKEGIHTTTTEDGRLVANGGVRNTRRPRVPVGINGVLKANNTFGDFDRGLSKNVDGAFINKADEGNANFDFTRTGGTRLPYYLGFSGFEEAGPTFFSPNRLMPSAVMFGSLPSRPLANPPRPWETLLFRPQVAPGEHPGFETVPDHYYLDLFHMPVVEPYAISEPFSTAGKINLNYEIAPYGYVKGQGSRPYLERTTGIHAVLKATKMLLVPNSATEGGHVEDPTSNSERFRYHIDRRKTIQVIQDRLDNKGLFKTASEICEIPLVPEAVPGQTPQGINTSNPVQTDWASFWQTRYGLTGDNQRERPYAYIYPRVTTRSNVYTVYVRAQGIRKAPNSPADEFDEKRDQVTGEYRGQTTIERYIDPNDKLLRNYDPTKNGPNGGSVDRFYRYRIVNNRQFVAN